MHAPSLPSREQLIHIGNLQAVVEAATADVATLLKRPRLSADPAKRTDNIVRLGHWQIQLRTAQDDLLAAERARDAAIEALRAA